MNKRTRNRRIAFALEFLRLHRALPEKDISALERSFDGLPKLTKSDKYRMAWRAQDNVIVKLAVFIARNMKVEINGEQWFCLLDDLRQGGTDRVFLVSLDPAQ